MRIIAIINCGGTKCLTELIKWDAVPACYSCGLNFSTLDPRPYTRNPKPETLNPTPYNPAHSPKAELKKWGKHSEDNVHKKHKKKYEKAVRACATVNPCLCLAK
jgi:hypothetical protein